MTGAVLSGAIAAVDFDATKADVRRAVEDFLIILPRLRTPMLPAPRATLRLAAAIAGALLLPLLPGRSFATMRCNSSFQRLVG